MPFSIAKTAKDCVDKISSRMFFCEIIIMANKPIMIVISNNELI